VGIIAFYIVGLCLSIALFILLAHRWTIKPLSIFFTIMSGLSAYFIAKYDVAIDHSMIMNTFNTDTTEVWGLLSFQMIPYILFLIILPITVIYFVQITFAGPIKYLLRSITLFSISIVLALSLLYVQFDSIHRAANTSRKYILHQLIPVNHNQSMISIIQKSIEAYLPDRERKEINVSARTLSQDNLVVVLAVGESARQKNFSLYGYTRQNTNPILSKDKDLHLLNGVAKYGSTLYALPEILSKQDVALATITAKAGVNSACYSHFSLYDNCGTVEQTRVSNCNYGDRCYDEDVIPLLNENLKSYTSGYRFIVLHLGGGSHGPNYQRRIPPEFYHFKPMCEDADVVNECTIDELYNSYDNTIVYTDYVLGGVINELDSSGVPYVFIYVSDHGESLMENNRVFHGMPPGIPLPPEQRNVPLIVKSSIPLSILKRQEYKQPDVYDSVLDLLSIESNITDNGGSFLKKY
jgi:lipid A ethanolaminephosphotransferase